MTSMSSQPSLEIVAGPDLTAAVDEVTVPGTGAVFEATNVVTSWEDTRRTLSAAFELSRRAAQAESSFVYVVHADDLLGRRGAPSAMTATGLLSAARTAAIESARAGAVVNVVAVGDATPPAITARWVGRLLERDGPTGELVRLDPDHLGKALP